MTEEAAINSLRVGAGGPGRQKPVHDDGRPSCVPQAEKAFCFFLNFQLVDKSSQNTQWRETIAI